MYYVSNIDLYTSMKVVSKNIQSLNRDVDFIVGKNAADNFDIIDDANSRDIWFHIENEPSGHIVAKMPEIELNKKQLRQIITQGAVVCKENSKFKSMKNVKIVFTYVENVVKMDIPGSVMLLKSKNISI